MLSHNLTHWNVQETYFLFDGVNTLPTTPMLHSGNLFYVGIQQMLSNGGYIDKHSMGLIV